MKQNFYCLIFLFFITLSFAQDIQNGYYITNTGEKVEGYFKQTDFFNQNLLKFSTSENGEFAKPNIDNIKEYAIGNNFKFIKQEVKIDNANVNKVNENREPDFQKESIFLNVLVEGDASLYSYESSLGTKYFYKIENKNLVPQQLVYRKYYISNRGISENNKFRQDLYQSLTCGSDYKMEKFLYIDYSKRDMIPLFEKYNKCKGSPYKVYNNKGIDPVKINYTIFAGATYSTFGVDNWTTAIKDENTTSYILGAEVAVTIPSKKFSFYLRGSYEKLSAEAKGPYRPSDFSPVYSNHIFDADVNLFNIFVGPRYNLLINTKNKIFIDGGMGFTIPSGDVVFRSEPLSASNPKTSTNISLKKPISFNFGVGYEYNKYGVDLRMNTTRKLFSDSVTPQMNYTTLMLTLRYTLN